MGVPILSASIDQQVAAIQSGVYSTRKINLPTSVKVGRVSYQPVPQQTQQISPVQPQTQESGGYDPKRLTTYPVYRGAQIALDKIDALFGGAMNTVDAVTAGSPRLNIIGHFGVGFAEFLPTAFMSSALAVPATEYILREPTRAKQTFIPAQQAMIGQIQQSFYDDPARFAGSAAGMLVGAKGYAKIGGRGIGSVKKLSPFYERGMRVYSGKPNVAEVVTGRQRPWEFHYTLEGRPEKVFDQKLTTETHRYYHGTSRDFMGNVISSGTRGTTVNPKGVTARGLGGLEQALYFGAPETGYSHFVPSKGAFLKLETSVKPLSKKSLSTLEQYGPGPLAGNRIMKEYYSAGRGELFPGVKPAGNIKYLGWHEWEYMLKPGTKLYPTSNIRTKMYDTFGMRRGTSFTVDPATGRTIEILKITTNKPKSKRFGRPVKEFTSFDSTKNPFAEVAGTTKVRPRRGGISERTLRSVPKEARGRVAPVDRDLFRVFPEERGRPRVDERGERRNPTREIEDRRPRPDEDITGIRWSRRGTRPRDYRGRGDIFRIPERTPRPFKTTERLLITQFTQLTKPRIRRGKNEDRSRSKVKTGAWDAFAFTELLPNMPVKEFLGI